MNPDSIIDKLSKSTNKAYQYFLNNSQGFLSEIDDIGAYVNTPINKQRYGKSESSNSFSFNCVKGQELSRLNTIFGTTIAEKYFKQVTHHRKPYEIKRLLTMHSSALLCLLFFNEVTEQNPLKLRVEGKDYAFTSVEFEFKNPCLKGKEFNPSNVDVKLTDCENHTILFLESKLSEYLHRGKKRGIHTEYSKQYNEIFNNNILPKGLVFKKENDNSLSLTTTTGKCTHYAEGIKQMLCHFIGAINYKQEHNNYNVLLGTILLDLSSINNESFDSYCQDYKHLAIKLNGLNKGVTLLPKAITYQEIAKLRTYNIPENVRRFYCLPK